MSFWRAGLVLAVLALNACASAPPPPPAVAMAPPMPPAVAAAAPMRLVPMAERRWQGGEVLGVGVTRQAPSPGGGYGLYVYQLPGDQVPADTLTAIADFNCTGLAGVTGAQRQSPAVAVMVLPELSAAPGGGPAKIDLALAHQFLVTNVAHPDFGKVYVVVSGAPLAAGAAFNPPAGEKIIELPFLAPAQINTWLSRLRVDLENGDIASPYDFDLKLQSALFVVGSAGELVGISFAYASPPPSCQ
jgi:hypothetical protein